MNREATSLVAPPVSSGELTEQAIHLEVAGVRVAALRSVGAHGVSFAAHHPRHGEVELWRLQPYAVTAELRRRLAALAMLTDEALLPIHEVALDASPPFVVVGAVHWGDPEVLGPPGEILRRRVASLAGALSAAHRLDVVHGALSAACVGLDAEGRARLDLSGLHVRATPPPRHAPELRSGRPSHASDVWALASVLAAAAEASALEPTLSAMRAANPEERPSAAEVARALSGSAPPIAKPPEETTDAERFGIPPRLGAYELLEQVGAGGMGRVFRARDIAGGPDVAVKVLLPAWAKDAELVARFRREARVLAQLDSPYVARFIAANDEAGFHYLVMEYVAAESASALLSARGKLDVERALSIACDVARAVAEVHALGLVHRDIKPANVLVELRETGALVKLCDFGIARETEPDPAQLTQAGTVGTPAFMAPEQIECRPLDARADVYALGATLYCLLTGQPPFAGPAAMVMLAHLSEAPAPLAERDPSIPRAISDVVMRCLAKAPDERYPDAAALHDALHEAWRGPAVTARSLPQPLGLEGAPRVYDFVWPLRATPEELWPHVSNTERLNRAAGLDEVEWSHTKGEGYVETAGSFRAAGMELRWRERPFEWVAPSRLGVVREYVAGPFEWLRSTVELNRSAGGGTELRHRIEIRPRGLLGVAAATVEVGMRLRRGLERVYQRIDAACIAARDRGAQRSDGRPTPAVVRRGRDAVTQRSDQVDRDRRPADPFEPPQRGAAQLGARVDERLSRAASRGADPMVLEALRALVCTGAEPRLARIRPRAFAREHGLDEARAFEAMLLCAREGALEILWDLLCPACRIPSGIEESLLALKEHGRCEVCDLDFELDMARSVELVFRVHPALRKADLGVYCIGGPAHSPHVLAQVRLAPGERFTLELALVPGRYRVCGRGVPARWAFTVDPRASLDRWDLPLRAGAASDVPRSLVPGAQRLVLTNDLGHEVVARLERAAERDDAVTAAEAASSSAFRELFPDQLLAPERLVAVSDVALLFARVADAMSRYEREEARVHGELLALARDVESAAKLEGGALVKLEGDGVMAVFSDRVAAARAALRIERPDVGLSLHAGPARMTTIARQLDYFGKTLHVAEHISRWADAGELLVSEALLASAPIAAMLTERAAVSGYLHVGNELVTRARRAPAG